MSLACTTSTPTSSSKWRKQFQERLSHAAITAGEDVVPASELAAAIKQIRELQRLLGEEDHGERILKEAVEVGRAKNGLRMRPLLPGTTIKGGEPSLGGIACAAIRSCSSKTWLARWPAASPTR